MNIGKSEYEKEVAHLDWTKNIIEKNIKSKNINIEEYKKDIVDSKKFMWEHQNEYFGEDLRASMNEADFDVSLINKEIVKVYKLYRSLESPYFCRIDFDNGEEVNKYYIGLTGVDKDYEPIVFDWRANIANLYYNYSLGDAEYDTPEGSVKGVISLKRQFDIRMGSIKSVYDSETGARDEYLEMALKDNTEEYMKTIVGTIQKEQNDCIRFPSSRNLVVEGVVGSGKTSVALHRVAYILYNQKKLSNKNILLFTPSEEFSSYISNVLPELGELNAPASTLSDLAKKFIPGKRVESLQEAASKYYENKNVDIKQEALKVSLEYKKQIDSFLEDYYNSLKFTKKFGLKTKFLSSDELNELKSKVSSRLQFCDKLEKLSSLICAGFKIDEIKNAKKLEGFIRESLGVPNDAVTLYETFIGRSLGETLDYQDVIGALYLYFEVCGYPDLGYIKEVVIDEVQDYPPFFLEIIKKLFRGANYTILGDSLQVINPFYKYDSLEEIARNFDAEYVKFNKAYRSSSKIIEYASKLVDEEIIAVRKSEARDVVIKTSSLINEVVDDVLNLKSRGYNSIGIIVKNSSEKEKFSSMNIEGVSVLEVYFAKGLEYDAVIVYTDRDNPYTKDERSLLYIALTRALHELIVYNQKI